MHRSLILLSAAVLVLTALFACDRGSSSAVPGEVSLVFDVPGNQIEYSTSVQPGATLLDVLLALRSDEGLAISVEGEGREAFVSAIQGYVNQGAGDEARNWMYAVNGQLSPVGVGVSQLSGGDRVAWCFVSWEERESCGQPHAN